MFVVIVSMACLCQMQAQEIQTFSLPNGLEVQTRHLPNTGIVHAKLLFAWTEGTEMAPVGTSWIMSRILPMAGSNGMTRQTFDGQKDQAGVLSHISAGMGWIAWNYDSAPASADLMIQFLADESLRPTWPKSAEFSFALAETQADIAKDDSKEVAILAFRASIGDPGVALPPLESISVNQFISYWVSNVRQPEKAILYIAGDIESISVERLIHQNFGPWEGIRPTRADKMPTAETTEWSNTIALQTGQSMRQASEPEIWVGWNVQELGPPEAVTVNALMPWILRLVRPPTNEIIKAWEPDPGGYCIRVLGQANAPHEELASYAIATLTQTPTIEQIEKAIKDRDEYIQSSGLYPKRALAPEVSLKIPSPDNVRELLIKCLNCDNLAVLAVDGK